MKNGRVEAMLTGVNGRLSYPYLLSDFGETRSNPPPPSGYVMLLDVREFGAGKPLLF